MPHIFPPYCTCDCQPFQACWYWSAVQPVETGRRGCPDLMDYCMRPRGTGTSVLTWLFNPRVGRDLAVSSPPPLHSRSPNHHPQTSSSLHFQHRITVVHRRSLSSTESTDPAWIHLKLQLKLVTRKKRKHQSENQTHTCIKLFGF